VTTSTFKTVYRIPLTLSVITAAGLLLALLGDGLWDAFSWMLLTVPLFLVGIFLCRSKKT
jgi:hypothetical protein